MPAQPLPQPGQAAPASHLAAFPPPIGGVNPAQLLGQAQPAAVSAPSVQPPLNFAIGLGNVGINSAFGASSAARDSAQYPRDPALASSPAAWLPLALAPVRPERSDKKPRTVEELSALLDVWLQSDPSLQTDTAKLHAFHGYAKDVIAIAHDYGVPWALGYHAEAVKAWTHLPEPLYCPIKHGPRCQLAFLQHAQRVKPTTGTRFAGSRFGTRSGTPPSSAPTAASGTRKRKPKCSESPDDICALHPLSSHTNAECREQHPELALQAKKKAAAAKAKRTKRVLASDSE